MDIFAEKFTEFFYLFGIEGPLWDRNEKARVREQGKNRLFLYPCNKGGPLHLGCGMYRLEVQSRVCGF